MKKHLTAAPILICLCVATLSCGRHKLTPDELERNRLFSEILKREDQRCLGNDNFFTTHLQSSEPEVQQWCAVALGRIGDPRALPWLFAATRARLAAVRAAAAFAIGEIEDREILKQEWRGAHAQTGSTLLALLNDPSRNVQMRAIEALGKTGSREDALRIAQAIDRFAYDGSPERRAYLELAITALMRLNDPGSYPALERCARIEDPEIQWRVENAEIRMGNKSALPTFLRLLESRHPDVRAYAARGIGICEDPSLAARLLPLLAPKEPLAVRICAVQAVGRLKSVESVPAIEAALDAAPLDSQNPEQANFAAEAATALGNIDAQQAFSHLARIVKAGGPAANTALIALARISKPNPDAFFEATRGLYADSPAGLRSWAAALGEVGGQRAAEELRRMIGYALEGQLNAAEISGWAQLLTYVMAPLMSDSSFVSAFWNQSWLALPAVVTALAQVSPPDFDPTVKPFLSVHDEVLLRAAVAAYRPVGESAAPWQPLLSAYSQIRASGDAETKVCILNRLEPWVREEQVQAMLRAALRDRTRNARIAAARLLRISRAAEVPEDPGPSESTTTDIAYNLVAGARKDRTVAVLSTDRGEVEIELFREEAPLTVANFIGLAQRGFYDGLSFMRVVPYFVVQGGDPRNDQEGGPGYSIRCEINMHPFERGSIGMALSGKDTGGSQFFITLSPQPHLDGGYTCFGRVISGMEAVTHLTAGDRIKSVRIIQDTTSLDYRRY